MKKIYTKTERLIIPLILTDIVGVQLPQNTSFYLDLPVDNPLGVPENGSFSCSLVHSGHVIMVHEPSHSVLAYLNSTYRDIDRCMSYAMDMATELLDYTNLESSKKAVTLVESNHKAYLQFNALVKK